MIGTATSGTNNSVRWTCLVSLAPKREKKEVSYFLNDTYLFLSLVQEKLNMSMQRTLLLAAAPFCNVIEIFVVLHLIPIILQY